LAASVVTDSAGGQQLVKNGKLDVLVDGGTVYVQDAVDPKLEPVLAGADLASQVPDLGRLQAQTLVKLAPKDPDAGQRKTVALIAEIMLFSQMIAYCMWVATGVVEEKASRVIEVLLSSTSARALLTGKIIGIGALGLLQLAATVAVGLGAGTATGSLHMNGQIWQTVGIVAVWFVLGYIFYASAYAAVAARVSRQEEMQTAVQPLNLLLMVPYFAAFAALSNPDAVWVRILSLIPPFSVLIQPVRIAGGDAAVWEPVVAIGLMAVMTVGIVSAGARVYENSVLRFGSKVPLRVAWTAGRRA
jgi:ABC-2 type transport system permease protein